MTGQKLSHIDEAGAARMVDVTAKPDTARTACARSVTWWRSARPGSIGPPHSHTSGGGHSCTASTSPSSSSVRYVPWCPGCPPRLRSLLRRGRLVPATSDDGGFDDTADVVFAATKVPGTTLYLFGRQMDKKATTAWAASDEIYYAAEVITDRLQPVDEAGGFIKYRAPLEVQRDYQWLTVPAGGG